MIKEFIGVVIGIFLLFLMQFSLPYEPTCFISSDPYKYSYDFINMLPTYIILFLASIILIGTLLYDAKLNKLDVEDVN